MIQDVERTANMQQESLSMIQLGASLDDPATDSAYESIQQVLNPLLNDKGKVDPQSIAEFLRNE